MEVDVIWDGVTAKRAGHERIPLITAGNPVDNYKKPQASWFQVFLVRHNNLLDYLQEAKQWKFWVSPWQNRSDLTEINQNNTMAGKILLHKSCFKIKDSFLYFCGQPWVNIYFKIRLWRHFSDIGIQNSPLPSFARLNFLFAQLYYVLAPLLLPQVLDAFLSFRYQMDSTRTYLCPYFGPLIFVSQLFCPLIFVLYKTFCNTFTYIWHLAHL